MLNFLQFTRKLLNVKLIKIKLRFRPNYKDSNSGLVRSNKRITAADIIIVVDITAKAREHYYFIGSDLFRSFDKGKA